MMVLSGCSLDGSTQLEALMMSLSIYDRHAAVRFRSSGLRIRHFALPANSAIRMPEKSFHGEGKFVLEIPVGRNV